MKLKLNGILTFFAVLFVQLATAQEISVTGTVTDPSGLPIPGVNVLVKGTTGGTQTDFDGKFKISAKQGEKLIFTFLGMKTQELTASPKMNVKMSDDSVQLEGVIVTSQGIKKEKKKLGYAISEIKSGQIEQRADSDVGRILTGKASGVNIIAQNGLSGSGTNIIIRGYKSFSSSNQALFIVDGVPFSSDTNSVGREGDRNDFVNGNNGSSRFLDLDPNNIESVNVLKGLAAATLYGSQGRNGVILITTKSGANKKGIKKSNVTISSSIFFNKIASLPDYQDQYGNGFDQAFGWFFSNWGPSFDKDGPAGWGNSPAFDDNGTLPHPYSTANFAAAFPEFADARYAWRPYNSVERFFRTGIVTNNAVNFRGQSDSGETTYSLNYSHNNDEGFTPGNSVNRNTLSIGGSSKVNEKLTVSGTLNYAKTEFVSPPVALSQGNGATGSGSSIFGDLWFTPRSIDIQGLPYRNPVTGGSVYYRQNNSIQHPYWTLYNSGTTQATNRVFGTASVSYDLNSKLNLTYRAGLDNYNESNLNYQNKGGVNSNSGNARTASGFYETWNNVNTIWDHNLIISGKYKLTEKLALDVNIGATTRNETFEQNGVKSDGQQIFGVLRHYNFANSLPIENFADRNIAGVYTQAEFDYGSYLFLSLAARKDWVSNFATKNNSKTYPSASIAFLPTAAFEKLSSEKGLNFLKFRFGIGTSANFGDFGSYPVSNTVNLNVRDSQNDGGQNIISNAQGSILGNPDLKPELLTEYELGMETKFFKNRFGIDLSLFKRVTTDLIVNRPLPPTTGFAQTQTNIGKIEGKGIELDLSAVIIKAVDNGFNWETNINFTSNDTEVIDLGLDTERVVYTGFSNLGNVAEVGQPLTAIFGSRILRDANGNLVVGPNGNYLQDPTDGIIGDANPDWVMNINNTISYKNFDFNFLINYTKGGDVYSSTISTLLGRGLIEETADRERTFILPGVNQAGQPNTVQINNSDYYFSNVLFGPSELQIYDATTIRLQEVALGYSVPAKFLAKTAFSGISFKVSGNNLYYRAINTPKGANFDPNTSGTGVGNGIGFDFLNGPSSKRYGFSLKLTF
jgi:TonB-linked SusC/RagA family outer membrane protein